MAVTVNDFREYLRLPPDNSENLEGYLAAAKAKAAAAGIPAFKNNALYDLFIKSLAALYYDGRGMDTDVKMQQIINSFVLELRYSEGEVEDEQGG